MIVALLFPQKSQPKIPSYWQSKLSPMTRNVRVVSCIGVSNFNITVPSVLKEHWLFLSHLFP